MLTVQVIVRKISHLGLAQGSRNPIDAYLYTRPQTLCLEVVLCSQLACTLSDCSNALESNSLLSHLGDWRGERYLLSSWRLSMRACFWAAVMPLLCFFGGCRLSGVSLLAMAPDVAEVSSAPSPWLVADKPSFDFRFVPFGGAISG